VQRPHTALQAHEDYCWSLAWSPDGKLLASCGSDKTIRIWNQRMGDEQWVCRQIIDGVPERTIRCVSFSPMGTFLAAASFDSTASIYEQDEQGEFKQIAILEVHENEVKSVHWDSSGSLLASCSRDKSVWIWEMESDKDFECISVCSSHTQDVKVVKWHPNKEMLLSGSYDDTIKAWVGDDDDWTCFSTIGQQEETGHTSTVWDLSFNDSGSHFASVSDDQSVMIWQELPAPQKGFRRVQQLSNVHSRPIFSCDWSKNDCLATAGGDNNICILVKDPKSLLFSVRENIQSAHKTDINCVRWHPKNPNILASCSDDGQIKFWNFEK